MAITASKAPVISSASTPAATRKLAAHLALLVGPLEEKRVGELLDGIAIRKPVVAQNAATRP